jgi:hypothetical protein
LIGPLDIGIAAPHVFDLPGLELCRHEIAGMSATIDHHLQSPIERVHSIDRDS